MNAWVQRDEREASIDRAADRVAYIVMSYGLLLIVAWRSLVAGEAAWDLMALVLLGGAVGTAYRVINSAVTRSWLVLGLVSLAAGIIVAALVIVGARL